MIFNELKKKLCLCITFIISFSFLYSMNLDFSWDFGSINVDGSLSFYDKKVEPSISAGSSVGCVTFSDNDSGFGLSVSPFVWNCKTIYNNSCYITKNTFDFLNLELFYDIFDFINEKFILGPYTSINYMDFVNLDFKSYKVDIGFKFSYFINKDSFEYFRSEAVTVKTGFRFCNNKPSVFIQGCFNLGGFVMGFINDSYDDAVRLKERL